MAIGSISIWAISPIARPVVPERVQYVVADSFYSKRKWVDGVVKLGWNSIGKLRQDANLKYLYKGPRRPGPGRQKTYDGKVIPLERNREYFTLAKTCDDESQLWTAVQSGLFLWNAASA